MKYLEVDLDRVIYGQSKSTINNYEWFEEFPYPSSDLFFILLKTRVILDNVYMVLMDTFAKIFDINIELLKDTDEHIYFYGVTCKLHTPRYWSNYKEKLFLYSMSLVHLFDTSNISAQFFPNTFMDLIYGIANGMNKSINPDKFFHSGMAKFMNSIFNNESNQWNMDYWGSIKTDLKAIKYILNSPYNIKEVLSRVDSNNFTAISEEIFTEFETMRKTF